MIFQTQDFIHSLIYNNLINSTPIFVTRPSGIEYQISFFIERNINTFKDLDSLLYSAKFNAGIVSHGEIYELFKFSKDYLRALKNSDIMGVWYPNNTQELLNYSVEITSEDYLGSKKFIEVEGLMPWDMIKANKIPWTHGLKGKRVLIIHPFIHSINNNYLNKNNISFVSKVLPDFVIDTFCPPVTFAGVETEYTFSHFFEKLKFDIFQKRNNFDIAIVGAGAYGPLISNFIYEDLRKSAIHLGGATQLLFGIIGSRWTKHRGIAEKYSDIIDFSWSHPIDIEKPPSYNLVEGGCYW
jgi:hypothetical protein